MRGIRFNNPIKSAGNVLYLSFFVLISACSDGFKITTTGQLRPYDIGLNAPKIYKPGDIVDISGSGFTSTNYLKIDSLEL